MKRLLLPLIAALALPSAMEASVIYERMSSNGWCSRGSKPKAPSPSYKCYKFIESNDGDSSVIFEGRRIKALESEESLKPIAWGRRGASHYDYYTLYLVEIHMNYLDNVVRLEKGLNKLKWDNRTYRLTNKGRWDKSNW
tara:strand:+ start:4608 stop:5024 length:417 start_codon:yes stop_codon:yes gene_type:complete